METATSSRRAVRRRIVRLTPDSDPVFRRPLMVALEPGSKCLLVWQRGSRTKYRVRFADIWRLGYQAEVRSARRSKFPNPGR